MNYYNINYSIKSIQGERLLSIVEYKKKIHIQHTIFQIACPCVFHDLKTKESEQV